MNSVKPKVFIATNCTLDDADARFKSLKENFEITYDRDIEHQTAEFFVIDLGMLPEDPENLIVNRKQMFPRDIHILSPQFHAPCLFVTCGENLQDKAERIVTYAKRQLNMEPVIANTVEELERHLKWLWCMFPYDQLDPDQQAILWGSIHGKLSPDLQSKIFETAVTFSRQQIAGV